VIHNHTSTSLVDSAPPSVDGAETPVIRIPHEHGAVITFVLSSLLAVRLGWSQLSLVIVVLASLWIAFLIQRNLRASILLGSVFAGAAGMITHSAPVGILVFIFFQGPHLLSWLSVRLGPSWRESLGMLAVSLMPLMAVTILDRYSPHSWLITLGFTASALLAAVMIRLLRHEPGNSFPVLVVFVTFLWMWLWMKNPTIFVWCIAPFVAQLVWLARGKKLSFKSLGYLETITLVWASVLLWLQMP
jgi:hypothetical protein